MSYDSEIMKCYENVHNECNTKVELLPRVARRRIEL